MDQHKPVQPHPLRPLVLADLDVLREIYLEAVQHAEASLYSERQRRAWSHWADQLGTACAMAKG